MGTNANGYEIRLTLLQMAKDMAYEQWHNTQNAAMHNASVNNVPVDTVAAPSFAEIEELAGKLYGFVQDHGHRHERGPVSPTCTACSKTPRTLRNPSLPDDTK